MNTTVINIRVNSATKLESQKIAEELGFSLSSLINAFLKQLIRSRTINFGIEEPTEYLLKALKESKKSKKSPPFNNPNDAIKWLHEPGRKNRDKI